MLLTYVNMYNQVAEQGFGAISNIAVDADNAVVLRDHIGTLVTVLECHRENAEVSSVYVVMYMYEYVWICICVWYEIWRYQMH